jgi:hypothetical protein
MEPEVDKDLVFWTTVVETLRECSTKGLALISDRELDGDPNKGVTELGFKLVLLTCLANIPTFKDVTVVSEKVIEGGRIDLYLTHQNTAMVLELKYERIGFTESTRCSPSTNYKTKNSLWRKENDRIKKGGRDVALKTKMRQYFSKTNGAKATEHLVPISTICNNVGEKQVSPYCKGVRVGTLSQPLPKEVSLYGFAMIGIGTTIITQYCGKF